MYYIVYFAVGVIAVAAMILAAENTDIDDGA